MLRRLFSLLLILCAGAFIAKAQGENNNWAFGQFDMLKFNGSATPVMDTSALESIEGCAAVSDAAGALLFYSNGNNVWNKNHQVMPNGSGILGNGPSFSIGPGSATDGVAIVPSVANPNRYYLFVLEAFEQSFSTDLELRYSVIDMTLNGGLGDVVAGQKNIVVDTGMSEKMTVVKGVGCSYWLICHAHSTPVYKVYKIDATGVQTTPVVSNTGIMGSGNLSYISGQMKVTPNRQHLIAVSTVAQQVEYAQFDTVTGQLSNAQVLDSTTGSFNISRYGVGISPDGSKLYVAAINATLWQYNLALLPSMSAVRSSRVVLSNGAAEHSGMRTGPDGKVYVGHGFNTHSIGVIHNPNAAGTACNYVLNGIFIPGLQTYPNSYCQNLGNAVVVLPVTTTTHNKDTSHCLPAVLTLSAPAGYTAYAWSNGDTSQASTRTYFAPGKVWVYSISGCTRRVDTFTILAAPSSTVTTFNTDTAICFPGSITLSGANGYTGYAWNDNTTTQTKTWTTPGTVWVKSYTGCTLRIDTFKINALPVQLSTVVTDTAVCFPGSITFSAPAGYTSRVWHDATTTATKTFSAPGTYWVRSFNGCVHRVDTFRVTAAPINLTIVVKDTTVCFPATVWCFSPAGYTSRIWHDNVTANNRGFISPGVYWVRSYNGCNHRVDTFKINGGSTTPVKYSRDTTFCFPGLLTLAAPAGFANYAWDNATTLSTRAVTGVGIYWVTSTLACITRIDTFKVTAGTLTTTTFVKDTALCFPASITVQALPGYASRVWHDASTALSRTFSAAGTYWVKSVNGCAVRVDTFKVTAVVPVITTTARDTSLCFPATLTLFAPSGYSSYLWDNASTATTRTVSSVGTYWVKSSAGVCTTRVDTVKVLASPLVVSTFVKDTALCFPASLTVSAPAGYTSRAWHDASTAITRTFSAAGTYWVASYLGCNKRVDTFRVTTLATQTRFSRDTAICFVIPAILSAPAGYTSYAWSDAITTPSRTISGPGIWWVASTVACSTRIDTIRVTMKPDDTTGTRLRDTVVCFAPSITLAAPGGYASYAWSNGNTGALTTAQGGTVWYFARAGCAVRTDSFRVHLPQISVHLGPDTVLCPGDVLQLSAYNDGSTYAWTDGSSGPSLAVNSPGRYAVAVSNRGCVRSDTVVVSAMNIAVSLGGDRMLCTGQEVTLRAEVPPGAALRWHDGSTAATYPVRSPGLYWVEAAMASCRASDTVVVDYGVCDCRYIVPSAFSPNGDGLNDAFSPVLDCDVSDYVFRIVNRWGMVVFSSSEPGQRWDGTLGGAPAEAGVYMYMFKYTGPRKVPTIVKGDVVLLR